MISTRFFSFLYHVYSSFFGRMIKRQKFPMCNLNEIGCHARVRSTYVSSRAWPMVMYCINPRYKYQNNRLIYDRPYLSFFRDLRCLGAPSAASRIQRESLYIPPTSKIYIFFLLTDEVVTDKLKFPVDRISCTLDNSRLHVKTEYIYMLSIYSLFMYYNSSLFFFVVYDDLSSKNVSYLSRLS